MYLVQFAIAIGVSMDAKIAMDFNHEVLFSSLNLL